MKDEMNNKVDTYIAQNNVEDITISSITNHFGNIRIHNAYGNLTHALINFLYDEEKVLKIIELLFQNGIDPNYKGERTGYTFLHLAFYGYTDKEGNDHSYSDKFILKLVNLAKKYNFDFNIQDNDEDTIIHSAIASDIYTWSIKEILNTIKDNFDFNKKDKNGRNIQEAINYYKEKFISDKEKYKSLSQASIDVAPYFSESCIQISIDEKSNAEVQEVNQTANEQIGSQEETSNKEELPIDEKSNTKVQKFDEFNEQIESEEKTSNKEEYKKLEGELRIKVHNIMVSSFDVNINKIDKVEFIDEIKEAKKILDIIESYIGKEKYNFFEETLKFHVKNVLSLLVDDLKSNFSQKLFDFIKETIAEFSLGMEFSLEDISEEKDKNKVDYIEYIKSIKDKIASANTLNRIKNILAIISASDIEEVRKEKYNLQEKQEEFADVIINISSLEDKISMIKTAIHEEYQLSSDLGNKEFDLLKTIESQDEVELADLQNKLTEFVNYLIENDLINLDTKTKVKNYGH